MLSKISLVTLSALGAANAAGAAEPYAYLFNGADWPNYAGSECMKTNQSPIDLRTDIHSEPFKKGDGTDFTPTYSNIKSADVKNLGKVVQVNLPTDAKPENYFESTYASS